MSSCLIWIQYLSLMKPYQRRVYHIILTTSVINKHELIIKSERVAAFQGSPQGEDRLRLVSCNVEFNPMIVLLFLAITDY